MQFNVGVKSISISAHAKEVFEELEKIRPKHISFSLMLAIAADEYVKQNRKGLVKIDDFVSEENTKSHQSLKMTSKNGFHTFNN